MNPTDAGAGSERRIFVHRPPWGDRLEFLLQDRAWNARGNYLAYGLPVQMQMVKPDEIGTAPLATFGLEQAAAQALMDSLWQCGLRPSEGTGSAGAMAATQRHLEDMRQLVAHALNARQANRAALKLKPNV